MLDYVCCNDFICKYLSLSFAENKTVHVEFDGKLQQVGTLDGFSVLVCELLTTPFLTHEYPKC